MKQKGKHKDDMFRIYNEIKESNLIQDSSTNVMKYMI